MFLERVFPKKEKQDFRNSKNSKNFDKKDYIDSDISIEKLQVKFTRLKRIGRNLKVIQQNGLEYVLKRYQVGIVI